MKSLKALKDKVLLTRKEMRKQPYDFMILACVLILVCFGIVMVFSASYYMAELENGTPYFYVKKQIVGACLGCFLMYFASRVRREVLKKSAPWVLIFCILLLLLVFVPGVGKTLNGSRRWIRLGMTFQPSEITKFGLILFMAKKISEKPENLKKWKTGFIYYTGVIIATCGLIIMQPNLSMCICLGTIWLAMLVAGGMPMKQLTPLVVLAGIGVIALAIFAPYRFARIAMWFNPWKDARGSGYQVIQSLYAVASGGYFGRGLGNSVQKLMFLPYRESDFIFAIIAEECGFLGCLFFIGIYCFMFYRGIMVAFKCEDLFDSLVAIGCVVSIASQTFYNMGVATKLLPTTGVTLPFISAGSTSLAVMMMNAGLLLNVSRHCSSKRRKE